jgi:hypothetical protein
MQPRVVCQTAEQAGQPGAAAEAASISDMHAGTILASAIRLRSHLAISTFGAARLRSRRASRAPARRAAKDSPRRMESRSPTPCSHSTTTSAASSAPVAVAGRVRGAREARGGARSQRTWP